MSRGSDKVPGPYSILIFFFMGVEHLNQNIKVAHSHEAYLSVASSVDLAWPGYGTSVTCSSRVHLNGICEFAIDGNEFSYWASFDKQPWLKVQFGQKEVISRIGIQGRCWRNCTYDCLTGDAAKTIRLDFSDGKTLNVSIIIGLIIIESEATIVSNQFRPTKSSFGD